MLVVFTFSITPKRYLHDLFAGHTDMVAKPNPGGHAQLTQGGFSCDCNNQVATSPFTESPDEIIIVSPVEYNSFTSQLSDPYFTGVYSFTGLRGPPAVG